MLSSHRNPAKRLVEKRRATLRQLVVGTLALHIPGGVIGGITVTKPTLLSARSVASIELAASNRRLHAVVKHISQRYRVPEPLAREIAAAAWDHAQRPDIEPLMVLAIIGVESAHNPRAVSSVGAQGLMQVMPRLHLARLQALRPGASLFDPAANIEVGVDLLQEMLHKSQGNMRHALQRYNGSRNDRQERYAGRVLMELELLQSAVELTG